MCTILSTHSHPGRFKPEIPTPDLFQLIRSLISPTELAQPCRGFTWQRFKIKQQMSWGKLWASPKSRDWAVNSGGAAGVHMREEIDSLCSVCAIKKRRKLCTNSVSSFPPQLSSYPKIHRLTHKFIRRVHWTSVLCYSSGNMKDIGRDFFSTFYVFWLKRNVKGHLRRHN